MDSKSCIFIGGAYGVGKSSLCASYASRKSVGHYTASALIKSVRDADARLYKEVIDPSKNQDALLVALTHEVIHARFLLDGHFVIKTSGGTLTRLPVETYASIQPKAIVVVIGDPQTASTRLLSRDGKEWSVSELAEIQKLELEHAHFVSQKINSRLTVVEANDFEFFNKTIDQSW
jgi:adenylate kinase